jgi:hypothetical protein
MYERIDLESEGELPGAELADRWLDTRENSTYALVTVQRALLLELLLEPVEAAQDQAQALLDGEQGVSADPARELTTQLRAYDAVAATFTNAVRGTAVARTATGGPSNLTRRADQVYARSKQFLASVSAGVAAKAARIRIRKQSGDGQKGDPREHLSEDLSARFTFETETGEEVEMTYLPVRFRSDRPQDGPLPTLAPRASTTDAQGLVSCGVGDLVADRQGRGGVIVEVDVERLGPSRLSDVLPSETFVYSVLTIGETSVAVGVETIYESAALPGVDMTREIAGHLTSIGFRAARRPDVLKLQGDELRRQLGNGFQYLLRGTVLAEYSSEDDGYHYFQATAEIEVVHLASGRVVQTIAPERALKVWKTKTAAGATAAVMTLQPSLLKELDRLFVDGFGR